MRLFIGIKLDEIALKKVLAIMDSLYQNGIRGNFTNKNNIHLTLSFLGEINENNVSEIINIINDEEIKEIINKIENLHITKMKPLKDMIVLELELTKSLEQLQKTLTKKLKNKGYRLEDRSYYPHITLVRQYTKSSNDMYITNIVKDVDIFSTVTKVILFESKRIRKDLIYISLN